MGTTASTVVPIDAEIWGLHQDCFKEALSEPFNGDVVVLKRLVYHEGTTSARKCSPVSGAPHRCIVHPSSSSALSRRTDRHPQLLLRANAHGAWWYWPNLPPQLKLAVLRQALFEIISGSTTDTQHPKPLDEHFAVQARSVRCCMPLHLLHRASLYAGQTRPA